MFFTAIVILGVVAILRIPFELIPNLEGETLSVRFSRTGSEASILEREILLPLEARVSEVSNVTETRGSIVGSGGSLHVSFEPHTDIKKREYELNRIVAAIRRDQPRGTSIAVGRPSTSWFQAIVMTVHVLGATNDVNAVYGIADELVAPRLSSVPGVSQAIVSGGANIRVNIEVDPAKLAAYGLTSNDIINTVNRRFGEVAYLGLSEDQDGRTNVMLDGRAGGLESVANTRVGYGASAPLLRHVADIEVGPGEREARFRINGKPAIGVQIFREQSANTIELGRVLRSRIEELRAEMRSLGIDLHISFDSGEVLGKQLGRLGKLALSGYCVALLALFVFLRQWRAVAVVGVTVPISVLCTVGILYLLGESLNLITLFGLAVAIGLLVDNSVVVYESILRQLEKGANPAEATRRGINRTLRAIVAASVTTSVVFLPPFIVDIENQGLAELLRLVAISILLPIGASLIVAIGLVPVLAHRLASPAALSALRRNRQIRSERGGLAPPDRARILLSGFVSHALRHPPSWITGVVFVLVITFMVGLPLVSANQVEPTRADEVRLEGRFAGAERPIELTSEAISHIEEGLLDVKGVELVETRVATDGAYSTVKFVEERDRPEDLTIARVIAVAKEQAKKITGFDVYRPGEGSRRGGRQAVQGRGANTSVFGGGTTRIVISGPDSGELMKLAEELVYVLENTPEHIENAWVSTRRGNPEIWVEPMESALESFGITTSDALQFLSLAGRDGVRAQNDHVLPSGREIAVVTEREGARENSNIIGDLSEIRITTSSGELPAQALVTTRKMPRAPVIAHRNGRREMSVFYRLVASVPDSGPSRDAVEDAVKEIVHSVPKSGAYTVEIAEKSEGVSMMSKIFIPVVGLMYVVLAFTFESLILPFLVMLAIPLTVLGAIWALVFTGTPFSSMASLGALALVGISVNASILLVDRIQQKVLRGGWASGAAALAAVKERTRPVLLTAITTIVALWPLAIATGRENEIWPPFATLMIGGMVSSTVLVLLVIPVGYILLQRLDRLFGRVGPWLVLGWSGSVIAIVTPLIVYDILESLMWQVTCTVLIMGATLAIVVMIFRRMPKYSPMKSDGPPLLMIRNLQKVYDQPGPIRKAIGAPKEFARKVRERGGTVFSSRDSGERITILLIIGGAFVYLGISAVSTFWSLAFWMVAAATGRHIVQDCRKMRGFVTEAGAAIRGGIEGVVSAGLPWIVIGGFVFLEIAQPRMAGEGLSTGAFWTVCFAGALLLGQLLRHTALKIEAGKLTQRSSRGSFRRFRTLWRSVASRFVGFDLKSNSVIAVSDVSFTVQRGMVGILGPNGAGKSTLLRQLAGIIEPTWGTITVGGVRLQLIKKYLARWVGYLPQDAGLPEKQSPREYLMYFAALYELPPAIRAQRVDALLKEVGLEGKINDSISSLSGGMRQRVAVARTLLRLPDIIIVDEPTVGLDPRERIRFRNLLGRLAKDRIVLFSTHVVEDVAIACERVLVMSRSRLCFDGSPAELAKIAQGKVWETEGAGQENWALPSGAILASEAPTLDGTVVRRLIAAEAPDHGSTALEPTPEDGYLWLTESPGGVALA